MSIENVIFFANVGIELKLFWKRHQYQTVFMKSFLKKLLYEILLSFKLVHKFKCFERKNVLQTFLIKIVLS